DPRADPGPTDLPLRVGASRRGTAAHAGRGTRQRGEGRGRPRAPGRGDGGLGSRGRAGARPFLPPPARNLAAQAAKGEGLSAAQPAGSGRVSWSLAHSGTGVFSPLSRSTQT